MCEKQINDSSKINVCCFIYELRVNILKITVDDFVYQTNWNNDKYYSKMVNGYKNSHGEWIFSCPTVNYLFSGIKYAIENHSEWANKKNEIKELILKYFLPWSI